MQGKHTQFKLALCFYCNSNAHQLIPGFHFKVALNGSCIFSPQKENKNTSPLLQSGNNMHQDYKCINIIPRNMAFLE